MISISTKERLKKWIAFTTLTVFALVVPPALGVDLLFMSLVGGLFLLSRLFAYKFMNFLHVHEVLKAKENIDKIKDKQEKENASKKFLQKYASFMISLIFMASIPFGVATIAYFLTGSVLYSLGLFLLPIVQKKVSGYFDKKGEKILFLLKYSTQRSLDLAHPAEAELNNIIQKAAEKISRPTPSVCYLELFDQVTNENLGDFKADLEKISPKYYKKLETLPKEEVIAKLKYYFTPNAAAIPGNQFLIMSSFLKHEKMKLTRAEKEGVIWHEFGHQVAKDHLSGIFSSGLSMIAMLSGLATLRLIGMASAICSFLLDNQYHKSLETNADLHAVTNGQVKGLKSFFEKAQVLKKEIEDENKDPKTLFEKSKSFFIEWLDEHPPLGARIKLLEECEHEQQATAAKSPLSARSP